MSLRKYQCLSNCIREYVPGNATILEITPQKKVAWALRDSIRTKGAIAIKPL